MRQKDEVGKTPQKENQARGKGTWQESPSVPAPLAKSFLCTQSGQCLERNKTVLIWSLGSIASSQPLHSGCWSSAMWLGTECAKQGSRSSFHPSFLQEEPSPNFSSGFWKLLSSLTWKIRNKSRLTKLKQSIKWKGRLIKIKPSDQFINQLVKSTSEWRHLYNIHKTHQHRAYWAIAGSWEQTAILSFQHTVLLQENAGYVLKLRDSSSWQRTPSHGQPSVCPGL